MSKLTCLLVCVVAVTLRSAYAISDEEKAAFLGALGPVIAECSKSHGVSDDAIKSAKETASTDGINSCFIACVLKKTEILDAQGLFDAEKGKEKLHKYLKDEADRQKFTEVGKKCKSVNEETVSDGEAGCERAKLLVNCFLANKAGLPFN